MDTIAPKLDPRPSQTVRAILVVGAIAVLGLWAWTWMPVAAAWNDPSEDGFVAIPAVMATFTLLPAGVFALFNALRGEPRDLRDARTALIVVALLLGLFAGVELYGNVLEAQTADAA